MADEIKDEWPRFLAHWGAATIGIFLRSLLPVLGKWADPNSAISFPRWWVFLLLSCLVATIGGGINSNLPVKPREVLKSIGLGFAVDVAAILSKIGHF